MSRTIITIALIAFAFWALRRLWRGISRDAQPQPGPVFEKTVRCEQCGVHVSLQLAIERDGKYYCCTEHLPE